jgi:predicted RNase H-like nuclease (RuvC/YqgF family)
MNEDIAIYEVMLELAEEENSELKAENDAMWDYIMYLQKKNKELVIEYDNLTAINKRLN